MEISRDTLSAIVSHKRRIYLIMVVVTLLFVCVAAVVFFLNLHRENPLYLEACPTLACTRAVHDMNRLVDNMTDPCRDFHGHVCRRLNHRGVHFLEAAGQDLLEFINNSLSDVGHLNHVTPKFHQVARFYQVCQQFFFANVTPVEDLLRYLPRYEEVLELPSNFSAVLKRLVNLSLGHGIRTILDFKLVRSARTVQLRIYRGLSLTRKSNSESPAALADYLQVLTRSIATVSGRTFNASDILEQEVVMERQLSRKNAEDGYDASVLDSLIESMKRDSWIAAFNSHIPLPHQLTHRSTILIDNLDSMREILHFFESLRDYGVAYIYIQVIFEALRFDYMRRFNTRGNRGVIKTCVQATQSVMVGATSGIVGNLLHGQVSDGNVLPLFKMVLGSLSLERDFTWMGDDMMQRAKKILDDVLLHLYNFAQPARFKENGEDDEVPWNETVSAFPELFLHLKARYQASVLADPLRVGAQEDSDSFLYGTGVVYDDLTNTVRVPAALRREPVLYPGDVPLEYSLGTLGALVAKELVRAAAVPSDEEGVWTGRERAAMHKYKQCVDVLARSVLNETLGRVQENRAPEFYFWIQGARTAYNVLSAAYVGHRRASNWDSYWKSAQRTFFRRFCLLSCGADVVQGQHNASKLHCFLPLLNMEEFSKAFECHKQSDVHSGNYCLME